MNVHFALFFVSARLTVQPVMKVHRLVFKYTCVLDYVDIAKLHLLLPDVSTCAVDCVDAATIHLPSPNIYHRAFLQQTFLRKFASIFHSEVCSNVSSLLVRIPRFDILIYLKKQQLRDRGFRLNSYLQAVCDTSIVRTTGSIKFMLPF